MEKCQKTMLGSDTIATEVIDDEGDVVLVVGSNGKKKLRVSSCMLKRGSSVFAAMFSGRFAEGIGLSITNPKDVELPDDNPDDMELLCNILHFRPVTTNLCKDQIHSFAILVDKYDCSTATRTAGYLWISRIKTHDLSTLLDMTSAAFLFNDPVSFRTLTRNIVTDHCFSGGRPAGTSMFPAQVFLSLAGQRDAALSVFYDGLDDLTSRKCLPTIGSNCHYHDVMAVNCRNYIATEAIKDSFGGFAAMTVIDLSLFLHSLGNTANAAAWTITDTDACSLDRPYMPEIDLVMLDQRVLNVCNGLCLRCVKENKDFPENCLFDHDI